jgi:hypothetical protein
MQMNHIECEKKEVVRQVIKNELLKIKKLSSKEGIKIQFEQHQIVENVMI